MTANFKMIDRHTPMFLPHDLQDWIPENDLARFVVDCIEEMSIKDITVNNRGCGSAQYPPRMMLSLLVYCYTQGIFGSRKVEKATYYNMAVRFICGGNEHPDHSTICDFRSKNKKLFEECFLNVLLLAQEMKFLNVGKINISVDGTKIKANASKHKAVSYAYAGKKIEDLEKEISELLEEAEKADNSNDDDERLSIPEELSNRQIRIAKLKEARGKIEERVKEKAKIEHQDKIDEGKKPRNDPENKIPDDKDQINFTDEESRIMKAGNGNHFEQSFNAQACVDTDGSNFIVGKYVTNRENDKKELGEAIESVPPEIGEIEKAAADTGYLNEKIIIKIENPDKQKNKKSVRCYVSLGKTKHGKTITDLKDELNAGNEEIHQIEKNKCNEIMRARLKSKEGREFYKRRMVTVEPVFGQIKHVIGFRQFLMRGLEKVNIEWDLVTLAYNFKRLFELKMAR